MDETEFTNDYGRQGGDPYDQLYTQQRANEPADYYGYGNR